MHLLRLKTHGSLGTSGTKREEVGACSVSGCTKLKHTEEYCLAHYKRLKKWGDVNGSPEICTMDGCDRPHRAKGHCDKHYWEYLLKTDLQRKLSAHLRTRLYMAVKKGTKRGSAVRDLGCSVSELKDYLEGKFRSGMSWDNWRHSGWHIDHIKPLASFDLTNREEFLIACNYTNLQPMWAKENLSKSDKLVEDEVSIRAL